MARRRQSECKMPAGSPAEKPAYNTPEVVCPRAKRPLLTGKIGSPSGQSRAIGDVRGFTLLELAVVVMVLGLVIGGAIVMKRSIRAAQLQAIVSEEDRLAKAILLFKDKFHSLPGDFANATTFWGTASGGCPSGARTGTQTCNGNGNGQVDWGPVVNPGNPSVAASNYELYLLWQHLANAGFIGGWYSGLTGPGSGRNSVPGTNVPSSQISGAGYTAYSEAKSSYVDFAGYLANNIFTFGTSYLNSQETYGPALTPLEAASIDSKIDDGLPGSGLVFITNPNFTPNCATTNNASTAVYNTSYLGIACALGFNNVF